MANSGSYLLGTCSLQKLPFDGPHELDDADIAEIVANNCIEANNMQAAWPTGQIWRLRCLIWLIPI